MTRGLKKFCKECPEGSRRPAPHPGPRCTTHHREVQKRRREAAHSRHIYERYGMTKEHYEALYEAQGGLCYICKRATGRRRKLAVDHDHKTGYVRGLLCSPCNNILAHIRDDLHAASRILSYLANPPAHEIIGKVKPEDE
jgi:recombination endonuclease VII